MPNKASETIVELGRMNALSDGVYAIALTLLAFDIRIPDNTLAGELSTTLVALAPKLLIYLISFIAIGGAWGSHQRMLSQIKRGDGLPVWFNLLSLLFVTLLPASAALLGRFPSEYIAIVLFAADVILIQLTALWLWRHASKYGLLNASLDPRVVRSIGRRLILSAVCFGLSVVLVVLNTNLVYIGWISLFVFIFTTDWLSWQQVTKTTQV
ncbi:MAG: TMEM175 family protein, partial [Chloroflexota bacterium]